ncbi:DNAAF1 family protein [Megaselia abdita]
MSSYSCSGKRNSTIIGDVTSLQKITKKGLLEICKKHKLYQTPYLNDVLYLHYQGYQQIENLEEYVGLKCLWLECNAISLIQGLENQRQLKCLYLQNNLIKKIGNLENCSELDSINLSHNHISQIENCTSDVLPVLTSLNLSHNYLKTYENLANLAYCHSITNLDLSHNRIEDILVVKIFAKMPDLRVLILQGNPVVSGIPQYRKTLILECKALTYLDSRPVFPRDRACAEAWKRGGYEEERKENERWNRKDRKKIRDSVNAVLRLRRKHGRCDSDNLSLPSTDDEDDGKDGGIRKRNCGSNINTNLSSSSEDEEDSEDSLKPYNMGSFPLETRTCIICHRVGCKDKHDKRKPKTLYTNPEELLEGSCIFVEEVVDDCVKCGGDGPNILSGEVEPSTNGHEKAAGDVYTEKLKEIKEQLEIEYADSEEDEGNEDDINVKSIDNIADFKLKQEKSEDIISISSDSSIGEFILNTTLPEVFNQIDKLYRDVVKEEAVLNVRPRDSYDFMENSFLREILSQWNFGVDVKNIEDYLEDSFLSIKLSQWNFGVNVDKHSPTDCDAKEEDTPSRKKRQLDTELQSNTRQCPFTKRLKIQDSSPSRTITPDYKSAENLSDTEVDVLEAVVREDFLHQKEIGTNDVFLNFNIPEGKEKVVGDIIETLLEF